MLRKIVTVALVVLAYTGNAVSGTASNLVIDSRFVNDKLDKPGWIILDVRTGEEYKEGHIPGAVNLGNVHASSL